MQSVPLFYISELFQHTKAFKSNAFILYLFAIISMIVFLVLSFLSDVWAGFYPFSIIDAFTTFESGLISVHDVVLLLSFTGFFIGMTVLVMNRRKYVK